MRRQYEATLRAFPGDPGRTVRVWGSNINEAMAEFDKCPEPYSTMPHLVPREDQTEEGAE